MAGGKPWTKSEDQEIRERYPTEGRNLALPGRTFLATRQRASILGVRGRGEVTPSGVKRLFWDIETSPNIGFFWRASEKTFIPYENVIREGAVICICYKWEGDRQVHALTWNDGDDKAAVKAFLEVARTADEMVAHYGDQFDLKWFNAQCLKHGLEPLHEPKTVDTYQIAKRRFNLNSRRLDYLGKLLFGRGKIKTEYGLWTAITLDNCKKSLKKMVDYCCEDVRLLERVYHEISRFHSVKTHAGVLKGGPRWSCPECGSKMVRKTRRKSTAKGGVQYSMRCDDCQRGYTVSGAVYLEFDAAQ